MSIVFFRLTVLAFDVLGRNYVLPDRGPASDEIGSPGFEHLAGYDEAGAWNAPSRNP